MAKKQFIRHLEFYGFPDQNKYAGFGDIDLSDIREKNKEQDEEIKDLEGEKAEEKDLLELSGTVENLIAAQSEVNEAFAEAISGMSTDIEELKTIDDEFAEQISALTDAVDDIADNLEEFSATTVSSITQVQNNLDEYSIYADGRFAHSDDTYTKEEVDELIGGTSGYATVEWVEEQGFLTEESGDTLYARIEDFESFSGEVESAITDLTDAIVAVDEKVDTLSAKTDVAINDLDDRVNKNAEDISANTEAIADLQEEISGTSADIDAISAQVRTNKTNIARCADAIRERATKTELGEVRQELKNDIAELDEKKADKEAIDVLSGAIETIDGKLDAEIARSKAEDLQIKTDVAALNGRVTTAEAKVAACERKVETIESGLTKEIADREQGDLNIIGNASDTYDKITIYGTRAYADKIYVEAVGSAKTYTDNIATVLERDFADLSAQTVSALTGYATKEYVDNRVNNVTTALRGEIRSGVQSAITYTDDEIEKVNANIEELDDFVRHPITGLSTSVNKNSTILNAFTAWDGEGDYTDEGNGIVDVMHREIHEMDETISSELFARAEYDPISNKIYFYSKNGEVLSSIDASEFVPGSIDNIWYDENTKELVIVWHAGGEVKETRIPIGDLIDLSDYYKKEETDALLDKKLDISAYTDVSEQVSANTENIESLSGNVVNLDSALASLVEKLGYKDNESLITNGEHEVAFGEYNISHESEDASGQTIFSIGNGDNDGNRSNAVEVMKNGDVYLWIEGEFMNINKLLGQIAHEIYDKDTNNNNNHFFDGN